MTVQEVLDNVKHVADNEGLLSGEEEAVLDALIEVFTKIQGDAASQIRRLGKEVAP